MQQKVVVDPRLLENRNGDKNRTFSNDTKIEILFKTNKKKHVNKLSQEFDLV